MCVCVCVLAHRRKTWNCTPTSHWRAHTVITCKLYNRWQKYLFRLRACFELSVGKMKGRVERIVAEGQAVLSRTNIGQNTALIHRAYGIYEAHHLQSWTSDLSEDQNAAFPTNRLRSHAQHEMLSLRTHARDRCHPNTASLPSRNIYTLLHHADCKALFYPTKHCKWSISSIITIHYIIILHYMSCLRLLLWFTFMYRCSSFNLKLWQ